MCRGEWDGFIEEGQRIRKPTHFTPLLFHKRIPIQRGRGAGFGDFRVALEAARTPPRSPRTRTESDFDIRQGLKDFFFLFPMSRKQRIAHRNIPQNQICKKETRSRRASHRNIPTEGNISLFFPIILIIFPFQMVPFVLYFNKYPHRWLKPPFYINTAFLQICHRTGFFFKLPIYTWTSSSSNPLSNGDFTPVLGSARPKTAARGGRHPPAPTR